MSAIHYFQRYSQRENVATNNTLLLFSRLYQYSPHKFKIFISDLLNDNDIEAGIQIRQQEAGINSIPDGNISQTSFKLVIETKLHSDFTIDQLNNHLKAFKNEQYQILLSLSPESPENNLKTTIETNVRDFNEQNRLKIKYQPITFKEIVDKFNNCLDDHDSDLLEIIDDYESFCIHENLLAIDDVIMRAVTCGWTLQDNLQFNLYYAPAERSYSKHTYIGI